MIDGTLLTLIRKLAPRISQVKEWVDEVKRENPELDRDELAEYLSAQIIATYTKQGAALALPGALPGLGTLMQVGVEGIATSADVALMVRNQAYLSFALASCYGIRGRETLLQDTLICMALWTNALSMTKSGTIGLAPRSFKRPSRKGCRVGC